GSFSDMTGFAPGEIVMPDTGGFADCARRFRLADEWSGTRSPTSPLVATPIAVARTQMVEPWGAVNETAAVESEASSIGVMIREDPFFSTWVAWTLALVAGEASGLNRYPLTVH